jgi:Flp pilus assembly protein TadD
MFTPNNAKAWHNLGVRLYNQGRLHEAEEAYRKAVESDPSQRVSWSNLYCVLREIGGRVEEAQFAYAKSFGVAVADQDTGEKRVRYISDDVAQKLATMVQSLGKGHPLAPQERYDEAEQVVRHTIIDYPDDPRSKLMLVDLLVERGKYEEALPLIEEAIMAIPGSGLPWTARGSALGKLGRRKEAEKSMKRALEIEPHNRLVKTVCDQWFREQKIQ